MKKILAVSGGVDSMVMLDMMAKKFPAEELVVVSIDHGMRESSQDDLVFVGMQAKLRGIRWRGTIVKPNVLKNEEQARKKRYEILNKVAEEAGGEIHTAHHLDDLIESVAINCLRGTGPRGLAVLSAPKIHRPFIDGPFNEVFDKKAILKYACENEIPFRQDPTNYEDVYLRNRVRPITANLDDGTKKKLYELWNKQKDIFDEVDEIVNDLIPKDLVFERAWFKNLDDNLAIEILRAGLLKVGISATRPQLADFLNAIRTYETGKQFNLPNDKLVKLNRKDFKLEV